MTQTTPERRAYKAAWARQYAQRPENRQKLYARDACNRAIRLGRLRRLPCESCGAEKVEAHHDDYSKPLEVRWLCSKCHAAEHPREFGGRGASSKPVLPRSHCAFGHPLSGDNLFHSRGGRLCRECNRRQQRDRYWKRKSEQQSEFRA